MIIIITLVITIMSEHLGWRGEMKADTGVGREVNSSSTINAFLFILQRQPY